MKEDKEALTETEVARIRRDFPMLRNVKTMQKHRFCYLDNSATSFKPDLVLRAADSYYRNWNANTNRGDYDLAHEVDQKYYEARKEVADFIGATPEELVFTAGDSMSLNMVAYGLMPTLDNGDEIVLSEAEHASNALPWFNVARLKGAKIVFAPLDREGTVTPSSLKKVLSERTKVVSLAQVTNVLGSVIDAKALAGLAHGVKALFVLDGAQSAPTMKIDVKDLDCDFFAFSGHKMCGPTGIGGLYGKRELLVKMNPMLSGGGMNSRFDRFGDVFYEEPPYKFEAGTQNIAGAFGLAAACRYLASIGMDRIGNWIRHLRDEVYQALKGIDKITVYNPASPTGILAFNVKDIFSQDEATYLNSKGICVRAGLHCAKMLPDFIRADGTVRASFYFYNDEEDAKQLIGALTKGGDFLDAYFA